MDNRRIATLPPNGTADETWNRQPAALQEKKKEKMKKKKTQTKQRDKTENCFSIRYMK